DVDAFDGGRWKVLPQAEDFVAAGTTKRQDAQTRARPQMGGRESEQPRIAVRQGVAVGLKAIGRGAFSATQKRERAVASGAPFARRLCQGAQVRKSHCLPEELSGATVANADHSLPRCNSHFCRCQPARSPCARSVDLTHVGY